MKPAKLAFHLGFKLRQSTLQLSEWGLTREPSDVSELLMDVWNNHQSGLIGSVISVIRGGFVLRLDSRFRRQSENFRVRADRFCAPNGAKDTFLVLRKFVTCAIVS